MEKDKYYTTKDFYLSTALMAAGLKLRQLNRLNNKLVEFIFDHSPKEVEAIIQSHWDRSLLVASKDLVEAIKELKARLYERV